MIRDIAASVTQLGSANARNSELSLSSIALLARNAGIGRRDNKDNKAARYYNHYKRTGHNNDQCFKHRSREAIKGKASVRVAANVVTKILVIHLWMRLQTPKNPFL